MRLGRVLLAGLAAWGCLLTLLLASDRWPANLWPLRARPTQRADAVAPSAAACDCTARAGAAGERAPSPVTAADPGEESTAGKAADSVIAARYAVCAREESPPTLSRVRVGDKGRDLWALHCGPSVHLIAIEESAGELMPRRVLYAQAQSHSAAEAARAVRITAGDIDGDGRADLLVPVLFTDRAGAPASGVLAWLRQRAEGGFDNATRMLDVAVGDVVPARLDSQPGNDLALLHLADARAARTSELWLLHGGPAPQRYARLPAGIGASALAVADLDRDGLDDIAVASEHENRLRIWLSSQSGDAAQAPLELELEGVREVVSGDVDGDGAADLVLTGARVSLLLANKDAPPKPLAIADSEGLRDVHLEDANGDGKLDLIGYAHPDLIAFTVTAPALRGGTSLIRGTDLAFERHTLATLRGDVGLLFARAAQLDADARPDLVLAVVGDGGDAQIEFALAANVHDGIAVQLADHVQPMRDTALAPHFVLP